MGRIETCNVTKETLQTHSCAGRTEFGEERERALVKCFIYVLYLSLSNLTLSTPLFLHICQGRNQGMKCWKRRVGIFQLCRGYSQMPLTVHWHVSLGCTPHTLSNPLFLRICQGRNQGMKCWKRRVGIFQLCRGYSQMPLTVHWHVILDCTPHTSRVQKQRPHHL